MQFRVTLYQASFHTISVDAEDAAQAERLAKHYAGTFPGTARTITRDLVRWNVEPIEVPK